LLIRYGQSIDATLNALALTAAGVLRDARLPGVSDIAPAYATVCVWYDPVAWSDPAGQEAPYARIAARIGVLVEHLRVVDAPVIAACSDIPVCYGGEYGPDLAALAVHVQMTPDETIARHCAGEYRVAMLGFAPGFPYLLGLDPALHAPRRASPRIRVPAGSVAVGGAQTGIYPRELPGGWLLIGRTPLALFDAASATPALLTPGQRVRMRAISPEQFAQLSP
jgi:KipI family sensor histidine kinase inhibitor